MSLTLSTLLYTCISKRNVKGSREISWSESDCGFMVGRVQQSVQQTRDFLDDDLLVGPITPVNSPTVLLLPKR